MPFRALSDGLARAVLLSIAVFVCAAAAVLMLAPERTRGPLIVAVLLSVLAVVIRWLGRGNPGSAGRRRPTHRSLTQIRPDDNDLIIAQAAIGIAEFERLLARTKRGARPGAD